MKKATLISFGVLILSASLLLAAELEKHTYKPRDGYVPDAQTAVKIAEAVLVPIYGEGVIGKEKPLVAELNQDVWTVNGTLNCPDPASDCLGGVAVIEISKDDARILRV